MPLDEAWLGLVDDAAIFPPGDLPLHEATAAYADRTPDEGSELVGSFVLRDTDVPLVRGAPMPLSVVVTGGAGQLAGPAGLCARLGLDLAALEIPLQDQDDLAGNARRVVMALEEVEQEVPVFVELPHVGNTASWFAAADVVAEAGLRLKFRTVGVPAHALARWIDAALDRETAFKCTAGLHRAVRHDDGHGFLNVLRATTTLFDGGSVDDAVEVLEDRELTVSEEDVSRARRWFTSFGSCSVSEPWHDLRAMGLVA